MRYLVLLVAAFWMAVAITVAYAPQSVPEWLAIEQLGQWMRLLAFIPLVMGIILFFGAPRFHLTLYLRIIGVLAVVKGVALLVAPFSITGSMMAWYVAQPIWFIRLWAFVSLALALIVAVVAIISLFEEDVI